MSSKTNSLPNIFNPQTCPTLSKANMPIQPDVKLLDKFANTPNTGVSNIKYLNSFNAAPLIRPL